MGGDGPTLPVLKAVTGGTLSNPSSFRDLALAVLKIVSYMALGVILYTFKDINYRADKDDPDYDPDWRWNVVDCCYFTMVTITTVGYGDMPTLSQPMRIVTAFFGIIGVVQIASSLNVIAEWFVERARKRFMNKQRGLLKEAKRAGEMGVELRKEEGFAPAAAPGAAKGRASPDGMQVEGMSKRNSPVTTQAQEPPTPPSSPPPSPPAAAPGAAPSKLNQVVPSDADVETIVKGAQDGGAEEEAPPRGCLARYLAARPRQKYAYDLFMAFSPCLFFIICCFLLGVIENQYYDCYNTDKYPSWDDFISDDRCWTAIDSFYYSIITLATIGYGDVTPHSIWGRGIATLLIPFAIVALTNFMGKMHDLKMSKRMGYDKTLRERLEELNKVIEADDNGVVSPEEYILFNLKQMGKIDDDTVSLLREQFNALDADGSGELDADDLSLLQRACDKLDADAQARPEAVTN